MKLIPLTNSSKFAIVDDHYYNALVELGPWYLNANGYVQRTKNDIEMHQIVLSPKPGYRSDHKDRNPLNNQESNLRHATVSENRANSKLNKNNSTGYRGVYLFKPTGKYQAAVRKDGKIHHLGYFDTKEEAALAYNEGAKRLLGEFANLNIIILEV